MKEAQATSKQATEDKALVAILRDENSSSREKENAFNQLYSRHQNNLGHYFALRVTSSEVAEDLKMSTWMKVYEKIEQYDDKYAFTTWLYNIAKHNYIDHVRKNDINDFTFSLSEHEGDSDATPFQVKCNSLDPEKGFMRDERIQRVQEAINNLDNEYVRELMTERFINDLSFDQIAEKLGVENNSTLRVTIRRGKKVIKKGLEDINPYA